MNLLKEQCSGKRDAFSFAASCHDSSHLSTTVRVSLLVSAAKRTVTQEAKLHHAVVARCILRQ
jgi:hypothetical protein